MAEFDPRRAEPGQEFTYTTNVDRDIDEDEDVPEGAEIVSVDAETMKRTVRRYGVERTLKADDKGLVTPKTSEDEAVLLSFGLPKGRAETKADTKKGEG